MNATFLSTFSGVGGIDLGLERAGWRCVGQAEADPYRRAVLAERFPGVPCTDDVHTVGREPSGAGGGGTAGTRRPGEREGVGGRVESQLHPHLLAGGFPCQDLSVAGRRAGLAGERSGLFFEFASIADAVRPRWLLIENVPGLLTSNGGRDFGVLLGTLADLGYGVAWRILDSRFFGVPQRRRRVFIVASDVGGRAGAERAGEVLAVGSGCGGHFEAGGEAGAGATGGIAHGAGVTRPLTTGTGQRLDAETDDMIVVSTLQAPKDRGWRIDAEAAAGGHLVPAASSVRRLTPRECERLQGFPDDWTLIDWQGKPAPDSRRYAACGDAVTVPVARWLGERLMAAHMEDMRVAA